MPWKTEDLMDTKLRFIHLAQSGKYTITELCHDFGISRKTGHKFLRRYEEHGAVGLQELSRCPHRYANLTDAAIENLILADRRRHPTWGPKKLRDLLLKKHDIGSPPSCSTIGAILKRNGMIKLRRRRLGVYPVHPSELTRAEYPNHVWTIDFKGWFKLGNGMRCDPLTVKDLNSHFMIGCRAMPSQQFGATWLAFKRMAHIHGLPQIIRVDHGTPFSAFGLGRLSRLSIWWIEQGIGVEFTRPAKPQDNGSHERMHRDLKAEATQPPSANLRAQQRRFQRWVHTYNHERPHESLGMQRPTEVYQPSKKRMGENVKIRYPKDYLVRTVSTSGFIALEGKSYHVGEHFAGCKVGLHENGKGNVELHYANLLLGTLRYDDEGRFQPTAYIAPHHPKTLDTQSSK